MSKIIEMTVAELIELDRAGKLHTDQTTQRNFVYNNITVVEDGVLTKAGDVIKSCLEGVEFPPIILWHVSGEEDNSLNFAEDEYNIHDGKQRYLSFKYFLLPGTDGITVTTLLKGESKGVEDLTDEEQDMLANYRFSIQVREGTLHEEELSFYKLNTTGEPLTPYEGLRGSYHGQFIYEFEDYVNNLALTNDPIKNIGSDRGEQALWLLSLYFGLYDMEKTLKKDKLLKNLQDRLEDVRTTSFDPTIRNFEDKVEFYINLKKLYVKKGEWVGLPSKDPYKNFAISQFVIDNSYSVMKVKTYYGEILTKRLDNDLQKWTLPIHKSALEALAKGIECDGKRFADKHDKAELLRKSTYKCPVCGTAIDDSNIAIDHITPWIDAGKSVITNFRITCKTCNSAKGGAKVISPVARV